MPLDQETIAQQLDLIATHRRTLAALLQQAAQFSAGHLPAHIINGVGEARANIIRIKEYLHENGVSIEDEPNDEAPSVTTGRTSADQRDLDVVLAKYIDDIDKLLVEGKLRQSRPNDDVRHIARIRILIALKRLDGSHNQILTRFLQEAELFEAGENPEPIVYMSWAYLDGNKPEPLIHMSSADLRQSDLQGAILIGATLKRANLEGANLRAALLAGAYLQGARLLDAKLDSAHLPDANLSGADLQKASLLYTVLLRAILVGANLQGADLRRANLNRADLREADLRGADLRETFLYDTKLEGADLRSANLQHARVEATGDLQAANFDGANLQGAIMPDGSIHK